MKNLKELDQKQFNDVKKKLEKKHNKKICRNKNRKKKASSKTYQTNKQFNETKQLCIPNTDIWLFLTYDELHIHMNFWHPISTQRFKQSLYFFNKISKTTKDDEQTYVTKIHNLNI